MIPTLIEMGVDILNPVQTSAAGMDPVELKRQFGDRVVFWGGSLDCQKTLPYGTPADVATEVRRHVEVFAPGGGYVFAPVHNIQAGVPPENIEAMFDAARG
jgi:uroporphyrinogen decarboxylase